MEIIGITVNTTACDKHVPEIERYIRTIKERIRAQLFEQLPHHLIVEIAYRAVFWLTCFPCKNGIQATLSPGTFVTK